MTDEQFDRLPQYAQNELRNLRSTVVTLEAHEKQEPTNTQVNPYALMDGAPGTYYRDGTRVRFRHAPDEAFTREGYVDVCVTDDEWVEIHSGCPLELRLSSSNVLFVRSRVRWGTD